MKKYKKFLEVCVITMVVIVLGELFIAASVEIWKFIYGAYC